MTALLMSPPTPTDICACLGISMRICETHAYTTSDAKLNGDNSTTFIESPKTHTVHTQKKKEATTTTKVQTSSVYRESWAQRDHKNKSMVSIFHILCLFVDASLSLEQCINYEWPLRRHSRAHQQTELEHTHNTDQCACDSIAEKYIPPSTTNMNM